MNVSLTVIFGFVAVSAFAAFQPIEWIQAGGQQWINTFYRPACTDRFESKVRFPDVGTTQTIWCSRGRAAGADTMTCFLVGGKFRFDRNTDTSALCDTACVADTDYTLVADFSTQVVTVNADTAVTMAAGTFTPGSEVSLFASHMAGEGLAPGAKMSNFASCRFYSFKVYDATGTLLREYVPVRDTDAVAGDVREYGLFETQTKTFCPNNGTAAFTAGAALEDEPLTEEHLDWYVVTVGDGETKTLAADEITALGTKTLAKKGGGTLVVGAELADFTGDIRILEGFYKATDKGAVGTSAGRTYVNGGTFVSQVGAGVTWTSAGGYAAFEEERFHLAGDGWRNNGAVSNITSCANFAGQGWITLEGDIRICGTQNFEFRYGVVDANGHDITVDMAGGRYFRLVALPIYNLADVVVEHGMFGIESKTESGTANDTFTFNDGTVFYLNNAQSEQKRQIVFKAGSKISVNSTGDFALGTLNSNNRLSGPMTLEAPVATTFTRRNSALNLAGKVSGTGGFNVTGGGYLQLANDGNTFAGGVSVTGVTAAGDLNVTGGVSVIRTSRAKTVETTGILPVDGGAVTLKNAQLGLYGEDRAVAFPDLVVDGKAVVTGLVTSASTFKTLTKKGDGALTMFGPARILGTADIQSGTLRFGTRVSAEGLMWYYRSDTSGNVNVFAIPDSVTRAGVERSGARYAYDSWLTSSGGNGATTHDQCHYYDGYIRVPGEEGAEVTCNFIVCIARTVYVQIDDQTMAWVNDNTDKLTNRTLNYKRCVVGPQRTLTAGWHRILIHMGNSWNGTAGACSCENPVWPAGFGIGVDWEGRCEAVTDNYQKLLDPGDGSFLRTTLAEKDTLDSTFHRPTFAGAVVFGAGAVLDVNDVVPYTPVTIPALTGLPSIQRGAVSVTGKVWTVRTADLEAGAQMTIDEGARLSFAVGTTVMFDGDLDAVESSGSNRVRPFIRAGAGAIENLPLPVGRSLAGTHWTLLPVAGGYDLVYRRGFTIFVR